MHRSIVDTIALWPDSQAARLTGASDGLLYGSDRGAGLLFHPGEETGTLKLPAVAETERWDGGLSGVFVEAVGADAEKFRCLANVHHFTGFNGPQRPNAPIRAFHFGLRWTTLGFLGFLEDVPYSVSGSFSQRENDGLHLILYVCDVSIRFHGKWPASPRAILR
jgi:hypothetical protein